MENSKGIIKELNLIAILIISVLPVTLLLGSGIINLFIVILDIIFIIELTLRKNIRFFKNNFFYFLIFFWLILIINLFFSINIGQSIPRSLGFIRFIFFAFAINYYLMGDNKYKYLVFKAWTIIFVIISCDLIFEYIVGTNTLGFKSYMPGRLSGFLNQELKIGHLYSALMLICLSYIFLKLKNSKLITKNFIFKLFEKNIFYIILIIFLFISVMIGERSNFMRTLIMSLIFLFLFDNKNSLKKIISIFIGVTLITLLVINNADYKDRFWRTFLNPILTDPISMLSKGQYGDHYKVAIEVFQNHKMMGVGLKNYRKEVLKDAYSKNPSIHPHQVHLEVLSEIGIIGYISFFILFAYSLFFSIKNYFKEKNIFQLSGILFVTVSLLPFIPTGSFFTTYAATLFWLNFGLMLPKRTS